jgi:hypothetical protein
MSDKGPNFIEQVQRCLRLTEQFIRGRGSREDAKEVLRIGESLFDWVHGEACVREAEEMEDKERQEFSTLAVNLHNKTRCLPATECQEMRALLKPVCALLLYRFHNHSIKALSTVVRLLNRGGLELQHVCEGGITSGASKAG